MFKNILCMTALAAVVAPAFAAEWMTDFEAAKAKAAQENKAILVDFTGSDWCGYCIKLRKEVLDTPAFEEYAADKFVLMEVDMPRKKQLTPELKAQNSALCEQYNIEGFPTLLVLTPEGKVLGGMSGYRPSVQAVAAELDSAFTTQDLLKKAAAAEGDDKAKLLKQAYDSVPKDMRDATGLLQEVMDADTNNVTGIKESMKDELELKALMAKADACGNDLEAIKAVLEEALPTASEKNKAIIAGELESVKGMIMLQEVEAKSMEEGLRPAIALVEEKLATAEGNQKLMLMSTKFELQMLVSETAEDVEAAKATLMELRAGLPAEMQKRVDAMLQKDFADTQRLLEHVKAQREDFEKSRKK